jgi:hypothetical protein
MALGALPMVALAVPAEAQTERLADVYINGVLASDNIGLREAQQFARSTCRTQKLKTLIPDRRWDCTTPDGLTISVVRVGVQSSPKPGK